MQHCRGLTVCCVTLSDDLVKHSHQRDSDLPLSSFVHRSIEGGCSRMGRGSARPSTSRYISRSHALADAYRLSVCSTAPAHSITSAIQTHASESRGPGPRPSRAPLHHFSPFNRLLPFRRRREAEDADAALKLWWFWVDTNA